MKKLVQKPSSPPVAWWAPLTLLCLMRRPDAAARAAAVGHDRLLHRGARRWLALLAPKNAFV
ncbi:hypothetical protein ACXZ1M_11860 [Duganella sp. PWIR1]